VWLSGDDVLGAGIELGGFSAPEPTDGRRFVHKTLKELRGKRRGKKSTRIGGENVKKSAALPRIP